MQLRRRLVKLRVNRAGGLSGNALDIAATKSDESEQCFRECPFIIRGDRRA